MSAEEKNTEQQPESSLAAISRGMATRHLLTPEQLQESMAMTPPPPFASPWPLVCRRGLPCRLRLS